MGPNANRHPSRAKDVLNVPWCHRLYDVIVLLACSCGLGSIALSVAGCTPVSPEPVAKADTAMTEAQTEPSQGSPESQAALDPRPESKPRGRIAMHLSEAQPPLAALPPVERSKSRLRHARLKMGIYRLDFRSDESKLLMISKLSSHMDTGGLVPDDDLWLVRPVPKQLSKPDLDSLISELRAHEIPGLFLHGNQVSVEALKRLEDLPKLKHLALVSHPLTPAEVQALGRIAQLETLHLSMVGRGEKKVISPKDLSPIQNLKNLKALTLRRVTGVDEEGLAAFQTLPGLMWLELSYVGKIEPRQFVRLKHYPALRSLILFRCPELLDEHLAVLSGIERLSTLSLSECRQVTTLLHLNLAAMPNLRALDLSSTQLTNNGLAPISRAVGLERLNLNFPRHGCKLTYECLQHLEKLHHLKFLNLSGWSWISSTSGLQSLQHLTSLEALDLTDSIYTDEDLRFIANLPRLTTLYIGTSYNRRLDKAYFTNSGLPHLSDLRQLQVLHLTNCTALTDEGMTHLSQLPHLRVLILPSSITDAGIEVLTKHNTKLTHLCLERSAITDRGLQHLSRLSSLNTLDLSGSGNITDAGLIHLSTIKSLRALKINGLGGLPWKRNRTRDEYDAISDRTKIQPQYSDAGVEALTALPNLDDLDICLNDNLTDKTIGSLKQMTTLRHLAFTFWTLRHPKNAAESLIKARPSLVVNSVPFPLDRHINEWSISPPSGPYFHYSTNVALP